MLSRLHSDHQRPITSPGVHLTLIAAFFCVLPFAVGGRSRSSGNLQESQILSVDVRDKIIELQCMARCERFLLTAQAAGHDDHAACRRKCRLDVMKSPRLGFCPSTGLHEERANNLHCLDSCNYDFDCPDVQKCCQSRCGLEANTNAAVCMQAVGLQEDPQLPPIPRVVKFTLTRGHNVEITIQSSANLTYFCHVEARYHIGVTFSPRKLGRWHWQPVEKIAEVSEKRSKRTDIAFRLKPGRWYQVRVAAINEYGFRGYSQPSREFQLSNHPKPPKASQDLQVISALCDGRSCHVKIAWCPSKSNLPIEKYKIIWSLYVKSKDESFISNDTYVKDKLQCEIAHLKPDSSYYIQVQAISISGNRRLKSEKVSLLYNTTGTHATPPASPYVPLKCSHHAVTREQREPDNRHPSTKQQQQQHQQLQQDDSSQADYKYNGSNNNNSIMSSEPPPAKYSVIFLSSRKYGLIVQLSGLHPQKEKIYELCPKETNCEQREYSAIRAKKDTWEFTKLKFNTTYILRPYRSNVRAADQRAMNGSFTFTTPTCENFYTKFPKMLIKC